MASKKDIELGLSEERDNLLPLLSDHGARSGENGHIPLPHRALQLPPFREMGENPYLSRNPTSSTLEDIPSELSTAANTPLIDAPELWPKKWRRSDRRLRRLNTELLEAIENHDVEEVERLLNAGANPNATCRLGLVSACHAAALTGGDALSLLLRFGAEKHRQDRLGRTPLHIAAWRGNIRQVALLLEFPEDVLNKIDEGSLSPEAVEDVKKLCPKIKEMVHVRCDLGEINFVLPKNWKDNIDHNCRDVTGSIPLIQSGWTPLHVAASCARPRCTRLLLAAGADPNVTDVAGRTALDVAGSALYSADDAVVTAPRFAEVIKMLLKAGAGFNSMKLKGLNNIDTPLHTAVLLESIEIINELLDAGACIACLNSQGQTPLHVCVKKELEEPLQVLANYSTNEMDPLTAMVDVKDGEGHTVLQAAVEAAWVPGVCIALEAGADVTMKAYDGETPVHSAAALGNIDVLNEILSVAKQQDFLEIKNTNGETPLIKAVIHGHLDCLNALLQEGASIQIHLPGDVNVLHLAAENGHLEILKTLIDYDEATTKYMINALTEAGKRGFGPIHFAIYNNHLDCVDLLLSKNADVRLRTTPSPHKASTPLHLAALKNQVEIATLLLKYDKTIIHEVNGMGWFPLHTASHHGCRDIITLLLKEGADLSGYTDGPKKFRRTAIDMIVNNLSKPTEFMEEVFDSYIETNNRNIQDQDCVITADYRILMPRACEIEQMKVIQALLKTGNRYGQTRLLVHPLVESFLYLKWKALIPFFYTIIILYALFVGTLTIFSVSVFFYKDTNEEKPEWLDSTIWGSLLYGTVCLLLLQELLYMNIKSSRYLLQLETWIKFASIGLATILPAAVAIATAEWPRHVATAALLFAWVEMMFLLSRFPNWGYYVLMFGKVASNVIKILLTFAFFVIGFSLSFMIQFRSKMPFDGPWAALVKTMVMMTSEFDYMELFDEEHSKELATSLIIIRLIFVIFLILAAIVLMNLMVGVAVNDINDLEILGNIRRLAKQVEFLGTLDTLVYNKIFSSLLPKRVNNSIRNKHKVMQVLTLNPGKPRWRHFKFLTARIRNAIIDKALQQKKQMDDELGFKMFQRKIDEIYEVIVKKNKENKPAIEESEKDKATKDNLKHNEIFKHLSSLNRNLDEVKEIIAENAPKDDLSVEKLNVKVDQMSLEIESIIQFLSRIESKLGTLSK